MPFSKFGIRRLSTRLIISLTLIFAIVAGIAGFTTAKMQEQQLLDEKILSADQLSRAITSATWHAMLADQRDAASKIMYTIAQEQGIHRIRIFNKEGRVMLSTVKDDQLQVDKKAEACYLCHAYDKPLVKIDVPTRSRIFTTPDGQRRLAMVTPIYNEPSCSNAACHAHPASTNVLGVLDVSLNLEEVDKEVAAVQLRSVLVTLLEIFLMALFIVLFTRRVVDRPIRALIGATRAVSEMQLDAPITINSSEELGVLASSFDTMRVRLKAALAELNASAQLLETKIQKRTAELKAAHQKLLQSDRLASLGQLAASVAHEINNPLSGVLNLSMLMERLLQNGTIPPERVPDFRKYLSQVTAETARVGRIVSDLLAFSRRSKPQTTEADINRVIETTCSLMDHKLRLSNVEIDLRLDPLLPRLKCDASQMQQVVLNLAMNAAEATHGRERRIVSIATGVSPENDSLSIEVSDNGEGIPEENLSKIFDPFFTTKGEGKGVGLGLAVVYGIVDAHGGEIAVKSAPGEGTRFTVTLPLRTEQTPVAQMSEDNK